MKTSRSRKAARLVLVLLGMLAGCRDSIATSPEPHRFNIESPAADYLWRFIPPFTDRSAFGAVVLNGCVWTLGGADNSGVPSRVVESICNVTPPPTQWTPQPSLPEPLKEFGGVAVIGQTIYLAGGMGADRRMRNTLYTYNEASGWRLDAERVPVLIACGAAATYEGKLYVHAPAIGPDSARLTSYCDIPLHDAFAVYDPSLPSGSRWRLLPAAPVRSWALRVRPGMAALGPRLFLVGGHWGHYGMNDVQVFDVATEQWLPDGQRPPAFPFGSGRLGVVAWQGRLFALGGYNGNTGSAGRQVHVYSLATNSWDNLRPMNDMHDPAVAVVAGNRLAALSGSARLEWKPLASGPAACDIHEPDDAVQSATPWDILDRYSYAHPVLIGAAVTQAALCSAGDVDWFEFGEGVISTAVSIRLTPPPGADYQLEIFDSTGTVLQARSANPGNQAEQIDFVGTLGVGWLLRVSSQNGSFDKATPYRLEVVDYP